MILYYCQYKYILLILCSDASVYILLGKGIALN